MATLALTSFRWRFDDGTEVTATWVASVNTPIAGLTDTTYRLRFLSDLIGVGTFSIKPKLQYNKNSAGWNDVNAASIVARSHASGTVADETATTQQQGSGTFAAGRLDTGNGAAGASVSLSDAGNTSTEHEFCFQVRSADVASGDQILFQVVDINGNVYSTVATALFVVPGGNTSRMFEIFD